MNEDDRVIECVPKTPGDVFEIEFELSASRGTGKVLVSLLATSTEFLEQLPFDASVPLWILPTTPLMAKST